MWQTDKQALDWLLASDYGRGRTTEAVVSVVDKLIGDGYTMAEAVGLLAGLQEVLQ